MRTVRMVEGAWSGGRGAWSVKREDKAMVRMAEWLMVDPDEDVGAGG